MPAETTRRTEADREGARWSATTRRFVVVGLIAGALVVLYWIRDTLDTLILAVLLAYLLNPLTSALSRRLRWPRIASAGLVYLALIALVVWLSLTLTPIFIRQIGSIGDEFNLVLTQVSAGLEPFGIDASTLDERLRAEASAFGSRVPGLLMGAASSVFSVIFMLVLSFYLLKDADRFQAEIERSLPDAYRDDARRILSELNEIWSSFLRGQVILALIIGVVTTLALFVLGVRNALLLGLLAGVLEVVPTLGPIIAMIPAVLIAFFQGSTHFAIDNLLFALVVVGAYLVIQQLENHLIVPNVLGRSVNLPPALILFGALAGASLAGILGIFLAAPVLATGRLFLRFVARKLLEPQASAV